MYTWDSWVFIFVTAVPKFHNSLKVDLIVALEDLLAISLVLGIILIIIAPLVLDGVYVRLVVITILFWF